MEVNEKISKQITETSYLTTENTKRYRPILRYFYEQYERINYMLYKEEVYSELKGKLNFENYTIEMCESDLEALVAWGNLTALQDTNNVSTIEEFKHRKFRYQLSEYAVEIERLVIKLENLHIEGASLEPKLIERIKEAIESIEKVSMMSETDVHSWWEILNGDFIQSIVLLSENKININDTYNEDGDTILHLACKYMNFNVIRTLVEKFNANINMQNLNNQTPFYYICDTKYFEQEIISYFFKQKIFNYEIEDKKGINPLILSIKNQNMNLFYALCSIGCDLNHKDTEYHDIYYYAIKYDNLPALQYLLKYSQVDLFSSNNNLTPILIISQGHRCCKYLFKYHYHKVINGITEPLNKENYRKEEFNLFNYELVNTCFNQIKNNFIIYFFKIIFSNNKLFL